MGVFNRAVRLAALPVSTGSRYAAAATRAALTRTPASQVALDATQAAIMDKVAATLASARGPAMKFGQTLAMVSAALPDEQAQLLAPLTSLYEDAQPRPLSQLAKVLAQLPPGIVLDPEPVAAASLGQVHRATDPDGNALAVKLQYPDARALVAADSVQLRTLAPLLSTLLPSLDASGIVKEHTARLRLELDYTREATWLTKFAAAPWAVPISFPQVVFSSPTVLVTTWMDGVGLNQAAQSLSEQERSHVAQTLLTFAFTSPALVGATHADPHPGNYRVGPGGSLGVLDFGSIAEPSGQFTTLLCDTLTCVRVSQDRPDLEGLAYRVLADQWVSAGMAPHGVDPYELAQALDVRASLASGPVRINAAWLREAGSNWSNPISALERINLLRFPPQYLLEHRALGGALALAASLDATVDISTVIALATSPRVRESLLLAENP